MHTNTRLYYPPSRDMQLRATISHVYCANEALPNISNVCKAVLSTITRHQVKAMVSHAPKSSKNARHFPPLRINAKLHDTCLWWDLSPSRRMVHLQCTVLLLQKATRYLYHGVYVQNFRYTCMYMYMRMYLCVRTYGCIL